MRAATRLLAHVKIGKYLEPGVPTGLTGLLTARSPRPLLLYIYDETLNKLKDVPESSIYRQSVEALTKQRLQIVESTVPEGYEAWRQRIETQLKERPDILQRYSNAVKRRADGTPVVLDLSEGKEKDDRYIEWDGEPEKEYQQGVQPPTAHADLAEKMGHGQPNPAEDRQLSIEAEPALTSEQINEMENKIGAGLLEEVILVARGEYKLVGEMLQAKPWEELVEKPAEGQWTYFERGQGSHTTTQKPTS